MKLRCNIRWTDKEFEDEERLKNGSFWNQKIYTRSLNKIAIFLTFLTLLFHIVKGGGGVYSNDHFNIRHPMHRGGVNFNWSVLFSVFLFCMCFAYLTINLSNKVGFEILSNFKHRQTINNALYHNEHVLNRDKISCRKIPLNFGLLFQNLIYIGNISTLLQLLILNKAYYLEIKIGLINESHQIFSTLQPFWNSYFWARRGETGDLSVSNMAHCQ